MRWGIPECQKSLSSRKSAPHGRGGDGAIEKEPATTKRAYLVTFGLALFFDGGLQVDSSVVVHCGGGRGGLGVVGTSAAGGNGVREQERRR